MTHILEPCLDFLLGDALESLLEHVVDVEREVLCGARVEVDEVFQRLLEGPRERPVVLEAHFHERVELGAAVEHLLHEHLRVLCLDVVVQVR